MPPLLLIHRVQQRQFVPPLFFIQSPALVQGKDALKFHPCTQLSDCSQSSWAAARFWDIQSPQAAHLYSPFRSRSKRPSPSLALLQQGQQADLSPQPHSDIWPSSGPGWMEIQHHPDSKIFSCHKTAFFAPRLGTKMFLGAKAAKALKSFHQ